MSDRQVSAVVFAKTLLCISVIVDWGGARDHEWNVYGSVVRRQVYTFHARVAVNALRIVERELVLGPAQAAAHRSRLAALGCGDDAELAARIRRGELDDRAEAVRASVAATVRAQLEVANPRWLD